MPNSTNKIIVSIKLITLSKGLKNMLINKNFRKINSEKLNEIGLIQNSLYLL